MKIAVLMVCCALNSMVCKAAGRESVVRLCESAGVARETIRLSDFLPPETPAGIRDTAEMIELGRSPQLSSTRIFLREQIVRGLKGHPELLGQLSIPERVTVMRQSWPITIGSIKKAISDFVAKQKWKPMLPDSATFKLLGSSSALIHDPALDVERVEMDNLRHELKFAIRCTSKEFCGTFLVSTALPKTFANGWLAQVPGMKEGPRVRGEILAHAGQSAMLSMQEGRMHIFLRVLCLERGWLGQTIRAREASGHRIFRAEVVGAGALRASL